MSMIGKTLSHYEITSKIGAGGMGEVYQAKDQKLGREVAIKVLPEEFAKDTDRVARFEREAKLLASLNHPNIAAIHGLEESNGIHFLVLELVEGDTLAERIKTGAIPIEESLKLALQISEALEAAHEKGVIHRDLKPANIKITPEGKIKVLDFGLAKAYSGDPADLNLSNSPTLSDAATQAGVILGTAAYMAPEQAKGKSVDKRADIWAFGVVVFEMLTGRQLFVGETVSETLAAVLMKDVDFTALPANLHPRVKEMLERCLQKDPKDRYSGIGDARFDVQKVFGDPGGVEVRGGGIVTNQMGFRSRFMWIAIIILALVVGGLTVLYLKHPEKPQVVRSYWDLPTDQDFSTLNSHALTISPDGSKFVYSTTNGLYVHDVDELNPKPIQGTNDNPSQPFFSPDGKWIGYFSLTEHMLKKVSINGGPPVPLCKVNIFSSGSWGKDDTIIYGDFPSRIMRISAKGGEAPSAIFEAEGMVIVPQILPDGKTVLFSHWSGAENPTKIVALSLKTGELKELLQGYSAQYTSSGHIVYGSGGNLFAVSFDLDRLKVTGEAVSLNETVLQMAQLLHYSISDSGNLIYIQGKPGTSASGFTPVWVDREGNEEPLGARSDSYRDLRISPDKTSIAFSIANESHDIWIWDVLRENLQPLTFDMSDDYCPVWMPNEKEILYFSSSGENRAGVYRKSADGTGDAEEIISNSSLDLFPSSISNNGNKLLLIERNTPVDSSTGINLDISVLSMEGERERSVLLNTNNNESSPMISPNGRYIAYQSNESGQYEVYVHPFPEINKGFWKISTNGGIHPLWAHNGHELFYISLGNDPSVMAVEVETDPSFIKYNPKRLFPCNSYSIRPDSNPWDIYPDGKRFLMLKLPGTSSVTKDAVDRIILVTNWFEELKELQEILID